MSELLDLLTKAVSSRSQLAGELQAFRLVDGLGDELPDFFCDRFGPVGLVHLLGEAHIQEQYKSELQTTAAHYAEISELSTIYLRTHSSQARSSAAVAADLIFGPPQPELVLEEHGIKYLVRPEKQVNAGLFLDMREVRGQLKSASHGKRVLNTFCFTGSLGMAAFAGGAREVVQVDISKSILTWARENAVLNNMADIAGRQMRFIPEDSLKFMQREARRQERAGERYDLVIVDPPVFGSSAGNTFSLTRDLGSLITAAISILASGGELLLSCNMSTVSAAELESAVREIVHGCGRKLEKVKRLAPPISDFTAQNADSIAMRGVWCTIG